MNDIGNMQSRIAESEKRENELRLKLEELTDFVENASLPLHWVDGNGIIIWANKAELESLGYTKEEYIGQPIGDFHADGPVINDILTRLTNNETLQNYPARLKCKDGSIKHVLINSNVLMKDGKFIHTRCFTRDITAIKEEEQKKAALLKELEVKNQMIQSQSEELEKKIQEGIKEFKLKNQQLNEAQEIAKMGSWEWDVSTNKVSWTAGLFNVYDIPPVEEGLTYEKFMERVHPEDRGFVEKNLNQSFADKKFYDYYHRIVTPSGDIKILQAKGEVILDESGGIIKMIGTGQDITDQKKVEQELLVKTTELQKMNAELQKFAYIASHDLQEPLRKIKTFIGRLASEDELLVTNEKSKIYLTKVANAASRMQRLMDDILNFSRLSSTVITYQQTDLNNTIKEVLSDMEVIIDSTKANIQLKQLPVIEANTTQMGQIFQNLIGNAIKFKKPGTQPQIQIEAEIISGRSLASSTQLNAHFPFAAWGEHQYWVNEKFCRITIRDFGIGFGPEFKERIFNAFERLHNSSNYEGTGIGLAICKKIVDYHHGIIYAESNPEQGTLFSFTVPVSQKNFGSNTSKI